MVVQHTLKVGELTVGEKANLCIIKVLKYA